jgi:hypothetical protein
MYKAPFAGSSQGGTAGGGWCTHDAAAAAAAPRKPERERDFCTTSPALQNGKGPDANAAASVHHELSALCRIDIFCVLGCVTHCGCGRRRCCIPLMGIREPHSMLRVLPLSAN